MEKRSLFQKVFGSKGENQAQPSKRFELISTSGSQYYSWSGQLFDSDIVRAAVRPKANAVGKLVAKHVRGVGIDMKINPDANIRAILERPNPYMSMQDFLVKMTFQRELTHNAFAYIKRDPFGIPMELYPIPASNVELFEVGGDVWVKFQFWTGKNITVAYTDLIHLRKDFNGNDFFGDDGSLAIKNIMNIATTTDQGVVNAIKNSAIIRWIMMFKNVLQPEDKEKQIADFVKNYLSIDKTSGVAISDPRYDLKQVDDKSYVPNALQMDKTLQRINSYFGVNDNIVQNKFDENGANAFYESEIEPIVIQLSNAFTWAFFSARERGFGNRIVFSANNLAYSSMTTKLAMVAMVDRGALTPNEWREILNLGPIEGGDVPIRRLDTALVNEPKKEDKPDGPEGDPEQKPAA